MGRRPLPLYANRAGQPQPDAAASPGGMPLASADDSGLSVGGPVAEAVEALEGAPLIPGGNPAMTGLEAVTAVRQALAEAGMPRTSGFGGAEMRGWIAGNRSGSTGFSVRPLENGNLDWHIVISGKPHLRYKETRCLDDERGHEPINPEQLCPRIQGVFEQLGMSVLRVRDSGYQMVWDDDVEYNVETLRPDWLLPPPAPKESRMAELRGSRSATLDLRRFS